MYNTYTIGELAKILGITPETIRYYEKKGSLLLFMMKRQTIATIQPGIFI